MIATIILAVVLIAVTSVYWYLRRTYSAHDDRRRRIPGIPPEWFYGNLGHTGLITGIFSTSEVLSKMKKEFGDVYSFWLASTYCVVLSRREHALHVLADRNTYDQPQFTIDESSQLFSKALECLRGADYKRHARFMLPMFRQSKVAPFFDMITECVDRLIDVNFADDDGKIHADIKEQLQDMLIDITARMNFDYDLEEKSKSDYDIYKAFNDYLTYGAGDVLTPSVLPGWVDTFFMKRDKTFQRADRAVKDYIMKIYQEEQRRQQQDSTRATKPKNLIASLVSAIREEAATSKEATLTLDEVVDEMTMSSVVGFEPMTAGISWFIFYMSKYPEVQQKIKNELKEHNLTRDSPITQEILDSLVYVDCVINEVLRFAPTDPFIMREAMRDDMIDKIPIKKGDHILIVLPNLHMDPRYWNIDPSQFVPERWLNEDKSPPPGAYMPFGGGHRVCIGQDLALMEMRIAVVRLMQQVTFEDPGREANNSGGYLEGLNTVPKYLAVRVRMESNHME